MVNINGNLEYIKKVKANEIDWTKLFGAYNCGKKIGEDIKNNNLLNLEVLKNIENNIEHQSTFWTLTPFVMIFLTRQLEKGYGDKKEEYYYILKIYKLIAETIKDIKKEFFIEESIDDLEVYPDMKNILNIDLKLEDFDDEEEYIEAHFEEEDLEREYNSAFYYTNFVVENSKDIIEKLLLNDDENIRTFAKEILENL